MSCGQATKTCCTTIAKPRDQARGRPKKQASGVRGTCRTKQETSKKQEGNIQLVPTTSLATHHGCCEKIQ